MTTRPADTLISVGDFDIRAGTPRCPACASTPGECLITSSLLHPEFDGAPRRELQIWEWDCACGAHVKVEMVRLAILRPPGADTATARWTPPEITIVRGLWTLEEMRRLSK